VIESYYATIAVEHQYSMIPNVEYQLLILRQIVRAGFIRLPTLGTGSSKAEPIYHRTPLQAKVDPSWSIVSPSRVAIFLGTAFLGNAIKKLANESTLGSFEVFLHRPVHHDGIGFDLRHQRTKILFGAAKNILQRRRPLRNGTKGVSWDDKVPIPDVLAHHVVDGMFMSLLRIFGSLRIAKGVLFLVVAVTLELGEVLDGSVEDGGEEVPCSEFLLKTSDDTLEILDLMTSTMKSIPHDLGLMVDAQIFESFLHPANRHADEVEDRKGEVLGVEIEHGRETKEESLKQIICKTNKRKCYEEIDKGIFDGYCRGML